MGKQNNSSALCVVDTNTTHTNKLQLRQRDQVFRLGMLVKLEF